jgi:hypothetical protein
MEAGGGRAGGRWGDSRDRGSAGVVGGAGGVARPDRGSVRPGRAASAGAGAAARAGWQPGPQAGWQLAEHAGERTPDGMQRLLATAGWDPDLVGDDLRGDGWSTWATRLGCWWWTRPGSSRRARPRWGAAPVLGHRRQGRQLPAGGVPGLRQRQGAGVHRPGAVLAQGWTEDRVRCRAARVPEQVGFRTKPQLARVMLQRALDARVPASWVTADEV